MVKRSILARSIILHKFCLAGRKENALQKYPTHKDAINFFAGNDPSGSLKYLDWQLKILSGKQALPPEINDVTNLFHKYNQNLVKKDIYSYDVSEFSKLRDELFKIRNDRAKGKEEAGEKYHDDTNQVSCGSRVIYNSDNYKAILITNKAASMHHGRDTKWCITMKDQSYFEDYDSNNVVFVFVFDKKLKREDVLSKVAIAFQRDHTNEISTIECFDAQDNQIAPEKFSSNLELAQIFNISKAVAKTQPKSLLSRLSSNEIPTQELIALIKKEPEGELRDRFIDSLCQATDIPINDLMSLFTRERDGNTKMNMFETLARRTDLSKKSLDILLDYSEQVGIRPFPQVLALNNNFPIDRLIELSKSSVAADRLSAAISNRLPLELFLGMADDESPAIRQVVARNPHTPIKILQKLSDDSICFDELAKNPNSSGEILEKISRNLPKNSRLDLALILNPNSTPKILYSLVDGGENGKAIHRLNEITGIDYIGFADNCRTNKINVDEAEEILFSSTEDPLIVHYIRRYLARRSKNPKILKYLMSLPESKFINKGGKDAMISNILTNPALPDDVFSDLAKNPRNYYDVASSPKINLTVASMLLDDEKNSRWVPNNIARNSKASSEILNMLAEWLLKNKNSNHMSPGAKNQIIENPNVSRKTLKLLSKDESKAVSSAAIGKLEQLSGLGEF